MKSLRRRRHRTDRTPSKALGLRPAIEAFERRELMAGNFLQGIATVGTAPLPGATVTLYTLPGDTQVGTPQVTGSDGGYLFSGLAAGQYRLVETPPVNYANAGAAAQTQLDQVTASTAKSLDVTIGNPAATPSWVVNTSGSNYEPVYFTANSPSVSNPNEAGYIGAAYVSVVETDISYTSPTFSAYCVDLNRDIFPNPYSNGYQNTNLPYTIEPLAQELATTAGTSTTNAGEIAYLFNHHGQDSLTSSQAAGLQLAIWDLEYDATPTNLVSGNFQVASGTDPAAVSAGQAYLAEAAGKSEKAVYLDGLPYSQQASGSQGLVATGSFNFNNTYVPPGSLSGYVYADNNNNGAKDGGEAGIAGVSVTLSTLVNGASKAVGSTTTASDGSYSFPNLAPGTYTVTEGAVAGYLPDSTNTGSLAGVVVTSGTNTPNNNFGEIGSLISGTVYVDATGNGLTAANVPPANSGDTPEAGVVVSLETAGGTVIATTTTAANGTYSFAGYPLGTYKVAETVPANQYQTGPGSLTYAITTTPTSPNSTNDNFSNYMACNMAGLSGVYYAVTTPAGVTTDVTNLRGNTAQGDTVTAYFTIAPGSAPIMLSLVAYEAPTPYYSPSNAYLQVITSVSTGTFGPGSSSEKVTLPNSYYQVDFVCGAPLAQLELNGSPVDYNYENRLISADNGGTQPYAPSTISGTVYNDVNGNDTLDGPDVGIGGGTVYLLNDTGTALLAQTTTAANGTYSFGNLAPGSYTVAQFIPAGYTAEAPNAGLDGGVTTVANNSLGYYDAIASIPLNSNTSDTGNNFGQYKPSTVSGTVYVDANGNDAFDAGDAGLGGITVTLSTSAGTTVATTTSAANGTYSFTGIAPGTYSIQEGATPGYNRENANPGTSGGTPWWGAITGFNLSSGTNDVNNNFGQYLPSTVSGTVYVDANGNDAFGPGDAGLGGITVTLSTSTGTTVATTTSAANGTYSFTGIAPGSYTVTESKPAGYTAEASNVGSAGGTSGVGVTTAIALGSNTAATGYNFGELGASISGIKYKDATGNGLSSTNAPLPGDTPEAGVTIDLYSVNPVTLIRSTVTAADGTYSFAGLPYGNYQVAEVVPAGQVQTGPVIPATSSSTTTPTTGDCGFESISVGAGCYAYDPAGSAWTFAGQSGVTGNGSGFTSGNSNAPQGNNVAFVQCQGSISQVVSNWAAGSYQLSFSEAQRANNGKSNEDFKVLVDGVVVATCDPSSTSYQSCVTPSFVVGSGSHTITIQGLDSCGGDNTAFLDNVCVVQNCGQAASGSNSQDYYSIGLSAASPTSTNDNFANYTPCNTSAITNVSYKTNTAWWPSSTLSGYTYQGNTVCATFTVSGSTAQMVSLVSYAIPSAGAPLSSQVEYSLDTGTFAPGQHTVSVTLPNGYYQVDFACGAAIGQFGPSGSNVTYSAQQRLIGSDVGGRNAPAYCTPPLANVQGDIGNVGAPGTESYTNGSYTLTATGSDIWNQADGFNYVYQTLNGDGEIVARVTGICSTDSWAKAGLMIRQSLDPGSAQASVFATPGNGVAFQDRENQGANSNNWGAGNSYGCNSSTPVYLKLVRSGSTITAYDSSNGVSWAEVGSDTVAMSQQVYIGLAVSSHEIATTATFSNVNTGGYWSGCSGQSLIQSCGGWTGSTSLSGWLAQAYPNLYGGNAGCDNLSGQNNNGVANFCIALEAQYGAESLECQTLSAALDEYFTCSQWGGSWGQQYGLDVNNVGFCSTVVNTSSASNAFGNSTSTSVWQMILDENNQSSNGIIFFGNTAKHQSAGNVVCLVTNCGY